MDWESTLQTVERMREEMLAEHQRSMRYLENGGRVEIALLYRLSSADALLASLGLVARSALKEERIQLTENHNANDAT